MFERLTEILNSNDREDVSMRSELMKNKLLQKIIQEDVSEILEQGADPSVLVRLDNLLSNLNPWFEHKPVSKFPLELYTRDYNILDDKDLRILLRIKRELILEIRWECIKHVGFVPITEPFITEFAKVLKGKKCLELFAGNGALSKSLQDKGIDIIPTDNKTWNKTNEEIGNAINHENLWCDVVEMNADKAIYEFDYDIIIMSWMPPHEKDGFYKSLCKKIKKINKPVISINDPDCDVIGGEEFLESMRFISDKKIDKLNSIYKANNWYFVNDRVNLYVPK